jgi:peroxiredoxin
MTRKAPDFALRDLTGNLHLLSDYHGKVVWLEFWVTWCAACQETLPKKDVLYHSLKNPELVFLTIHVSEREADPDRVISYMEQTGFRFPVLRDDGRKTYDAYGIPSVPASVLIDKQGRIHGIYDETIPLTEVIKEIGTLLAAQ